MKKAIILLFIGLFIVYYISCSSSLYIPTEEIAQRAQLNLVDLKKGRALYVEYCSGCHNLYLPNEYSREEWKKFVHEMKDEAEISDEQGDLIYKFLVANLDSSENKSQH